MYIRYTLWCEFPFFLITNGFKLYPIFSLGVVLYTIYKIVNTYIQWFVFALDHLAYCSLKNFSKPFSNVSNTFDKYT